ncbi:hypothetical protein [Bacillus sp. C28GYM-DRY-1]|uniref:hypothetical protein n=1 Tax=Bacillus sp. C28GYM-DRY-1 TaxID=3062686 RepID=UPI002674CD9A|nr:hypothetical protein [Bacillus sp. C28GYM-DRY-1]MDO3661449.1 hypothetical protein [Bacillus sp. C28GYM-DRY-1]
MFLINKILAKSRTIYSARIFDNKRKMLALTKTFMAHTMMNIGLYLLLLCGNKMIGHTMMVDVGFNN